MNAISWSARIKALEAIGWSVSELARAIGKSPQAISDLKHGRITEPNGMAAVRIHHLHAMGIRPADIFAPSIRMRRTVVQESYRQQQSEPVDIPLPPMLSDMLIGSSEQGDST